MTDLVVISLEAWDEVWRRNQHLVAGLLRGDPALRVLFVEPAPDPLHALAAGRSARRGRGLRAGPPLPGVGGERLWLWEPTKWLPRRVDRRLDQRWAAGVVRAARRIGLERPLLWVNAPSGAQVLAGTGWPALYDITDDWLLAPRTPIEHERLVHDEAYLLEHCREVVVCSPALVRDKHGRRTTLIPNAVDLDAYRIDPPRPDDLPEGPVAVYVGTLHTDRLDVELSAATAKGLGDNAHLVLVGPDLLPEHLRARLFDAGVVLLGAKEHATVPAYLLHADVLVVPHLVNAFTDSLDPIKVYEYSAAARPVVATPVAGFREQRSDDITVAVGDCFAEAVRKQVLQPSPHGTHRRGDVPTWDLRVTQMQEVLARLASP